MCRSYLVCLGALLPFPASRPSPCWDRASVGAPGSCRSSVTCHLLLSCLSLVLLHPCLQLRGSGVLASRKQDVMSESVVLEPTLRISVRQPRGVLC
jgi:hypothetical protein